MDNPSYLPNSLPSPHTPAKNHRNKARRTSWARRLLFSPPAILRGKWGGENHDATAGYRSRFGGVILRLVRCICGLLWQKKTTSVGFLGVFPPFRPFPPSREKEQQPLCCCQHLLCIPPCVFIFFQLGVSFITLAPARPKMVGGALSSSARLVVGGIKVIVKRRVVYFS